MFGKVCLIARAGVVAKELCAKAGLASNGTTRAGFVRRQRRITCRFAKLEIGGIEQRGCCSLSSGFRSDFQNVVSGPRDQPCVPRLGEALPRFRRVM